MANDKPGPNWRNFAAWSAVGGLLYILVIWAAAAYLHQDATDVLRRPTKVTVQLGLGLLFSMAVVGFTSRKRPLDLRTLRNFLIQNAVAIVLFLLAIWGFGALARAGGIGVSEWVAAATGATLIVISCLGTLALASTHMRGNFVDDEMVADDMRERGRLFLCSFAWMVGCGLLLIVLALAGPGGLLSPATALAAALVLAAAIAVLTIAAWRLSDELARTLSHETGNMTYYLILVLGSGWSILAHLRFVAAPAPLDWLTMFTLLIFVASIIVVARRKLLRG